MAGTDARMIFVGGLHEEVTEESLRQAFLPFGEIKECKIPKREGKTRGFGFVEYEDEEDAKAAIDNMDQSEFFGKTLVVNTSKSQALGQTAQRMTKPVWADDILHGQMLQRGLGLQKGKLRCLA
ncbi:unnamed protein product [Amoebophrya sp. A120]|nr:unnamed protein product [Amoebophrya sp. A120]|eukprot:GSA120T00024032001.1